MRDTVLDLGTNAPARRSSTRSLPPYSARALAIWPRLDRGRLARTRGDPVRIARLVTERTALTAESIVAMLLRTEGLEG